MKPSLQLNINQHLTLTPQLQQAIRLLQLSTLDLQQEIQQIVEANPMLDSTSYDEKEENTEEAEPTSQDFDEFQWSSLYTNPQKSTSFHDQELNYENLYCTTTSLQDHLNWQLFLTPMSDIDRAIATAIIDAIDENGFLTQSITELHATLTSDTHPIDLAEIEMVRHLIQHFDPMGCGSVNLAEALLTQLEQFDKNGDVELAKRIISNDIELLGQHNYRQLRKIYQINEQTLAQVLDIIHRLHPKPGNIIHPENIQYIIPDVIVKKINGTWQTFLNSKTLPSLSINTYYASLIQRADSSSENQFLKNNLQEARWFLKSIQSRQETLLKVAQCIMEHQIDFLEHGNEAMKPLILNDIANALGMHESTISRVTTQKYIYTPRGVFELKYFFSSHVSTANGGECSSTAIRAFIKKIISEENRKKPLSDSKIAQLMSNKGIRIARRTIAKYREAMKISPSNERKQFNNSVL